ncbi:MFS transporter [Variovorax sp. LT1R16]|uniref:MFS transporter n=1 Tax=Variovorax sp. LT1R16 TaxID=3443728 RepID=UPI003F4851B4
MLLLGACAFCSMASLRICDAMLPHLAVQFSENLGQVAGAISSFALAYGLLQIFYGPMGDRFGKVRVIGWATLLCTVGSAGAAMAPTLDWLIAWRAASGAAAAGIIPLAMAWVGDNVDYGQRQEVLARFLGATVLGMICGQWLGGLIAATLGWRAAFGLMAMIFLSAGMYAVTQARHDGAAAVRQQASAWSRMSTVLRARWSRVILVTALLEGALVFGVIAFLPTFLHAQHELSTSTAGAITAMFGVGGLVYSRFAGSMLKRLGETGLAKGGGACLAAAFITAAIAPHWPWTIPACFLAGLGFYALHNTLQVHATQMAPAFRGTAVSLFACVLFIGQSMGVALASSLSRRIPLATVIAIAGFGLGMLGWWLAGQISSREREFGTLTP